MSYFRLAPICLLIAAAHAAQAEPAAPRADTCQASATSVAPAAQEGKRKLLGGFMRGLSSAAPLLGGHSSAMQAVTTVAGQTLNAASQVESNGADPRHADCSARTGS